MGYLQTFALAELIGKYGLEIYFESGAGTGTGFRYAKEHSFEKYFGVEIVEDRAKDLIKEFKDDKSVEIYWGKSVNFLEKVLAGNPGKNFLFWLDGHYPGEKYSGANVEELLPLKKELELIFKHDGKHVIIIDDLRIYEDAAYESGVLPDWAVGDKSGLSISEAYEQKRLLQHEGYLILTPVTEVISEIIEEKPIKKNERNIKKPTTKK
jgi:hypothetical protein